MYVAIARLTVIAAHSHSLKEKRMVVRRLKDRVRERVGVVLNEVGELDAWQRAELGCAVTSGDRAHAIELLDQVVRVVGSIAGARGDGELVAVAREVIAFDAPAVPVAIVDERTGSGDKALAGGGAGDDDWVPAAWRDDDTGDRGDDR